MNSKLLLVSILCLCIEACSLLHNQKHTPQPGKYSTSECDAVLDCLSDIWNQKNSFCTDNKMLVGFAMQKLVEKKGCFVGRPISVIQKYFGKPTFVDNFGLHYVVENYSRVGTQRNGLASF